MTMDEEYLDQVTICNGLSGGTQKICLPRICECHLILKKTFADVIKLMICT